MWVRLWVKNILNLKISDFNIINKNLRYPVQSSMEILYKNRTIKHVFRRGKYGIILVDGKDHIVFHLGMTGKFRFSNKNSHICKHDDILISFNNDLNLIYNDVRKFGFFSIIQSPVDMPEDYVKGEDNWYATTSDTSEHGESIIVRIMQGRAKKIEGNPDFPNTLGKHRAVTETEIQTLYHPDRISGPLYRKTSSGNHRPISWKEAELMLKESLSAKGNKSIITKPLRGMNKGIIDQFANEKGLKHLTLSSLHDYSMYELSLIHI